MQEKYLAQLGATPEMIEQQKVTKQQPAQGSGSTASTTASTSQSQSQSQSYNKPAQSTLSHQRVSSSQKKTHVVSEEEKNVAAAAEKKQVYANARPESSHATSEIYQKAQARSQTLVKQGSASNYTSTTSTTKAAPVQNNYSNQYASQVYASKQSMGQGSSGMGTQYSKMSQSGTNFAKKK